MQGVNIAKKSAAREKLLEAIQELTESGEIVWLPRMVDVPGQTKEVLHLYPLGDGRLGLCSVRLRCYSGHQTRIRYQQSSGQSQLGDCSPTGCLLRRSNGPDALQQQYAKELAARQAK